MKAGGWVAVGGATATAVGIGLLLWGRRKWQACEISVAEKGSQDPFECVTVGMTPIVLGTILAPLGIVALATGGALALVQRSE
jgi:hypothetical protein